MLTSLTGQTETLRAGAGRAEIEFPAELFPTEGFIGVHDMLHSRVLLLESGNKVAFVSIELTSLPEEVIAALQKAVGEAAGLLPENVVICVTHTFSAPHFLPKHLCKTVADQQKNDLLFQAIKAAVNKATSKAVGEMKSARFGCEIGFCDVNVNRDILTADGWWLGCNETGPSDKSVTVLRFETLQGNLVALLFSYAVQPSVMDGSQMSGGGRLVSADLTGEASRFLEQEYEGATALFCLGAAADQAPSLKAKYQYTDKDGHIQVEDIHEQGFIMAEMLGKRLGIEVLRIAETTKCQTLSGSIFKEKYMVKCPGQKIMDFQSLRPMKQYTFIPGEERDEPIEIIRLGDVALIGVRPELCCLTAVGIKEQSPFSKTMVLTMVNGGAKYMPESSAYARITYEAMNSPFARGSAELLCEKVVELLRS
jgi:neutral ceramidase